MKRGSVLGPAVVQEPSAPRRCVGASACRTSQRHYNLWASAEAGRCMRMGPLWSTGVCGQPCFAAVPLTFLRTQRRLRPEPLLARLPKHLLSPIPLPLVSFLLRPQAPWSISIYQSAFGGCNSSACVPVGQVKMRNECTASRSLSPYTFFRSMESERTVTHPPTHPPTKMIEDLQILLLARLRKTKYKHSERGQERLDTLSPTPLKKRQIISVNLTRSDDSH